MARHIGETVVLRLGSVNRDVIEPGRGGRRGLRLACRLCAEDILRTFSVFQAGHLPS